MTSSAVLAFGTGQRGSLDQVLENLHLPRANTNSWLENAHRAGRRVMAVGDAAWNQLYGKWLDEYRSDPEGPAIEADFNLQTFGNARELAAKSPDFLVVHFVSPDHQGHAYGVKSPRYSQHIHAFDQSLFDWLNSLSREWTVIVTSDHGAADSGTHGTDTVVQRRCPIFAYGPGILPNVHLARALDQVELPGLFAALLGVRTAQQSRGITLIDWLDLPKPDKRRLACEEAERVTTLVTEPMRSELSHSLTSAQRCCQGAPKEQTCIDQARALGAAYDSEIGENQGIDSSRGWPWVVAVFLAAVLIAHFIYGMRAIAPIAIGCLWLAASLGLTYSVERLPGAAPNCVRALLFVITNGCLLIGCVRFDFWAPILARHRALAVSLIPGWLLVSYTTNTQVEAYLIVVLFAVFLAVRGVRGNGLLECLRRQVAANKLDSIIIVASIVLLSLPGTKPSDVWPRILDKSSLVALIVAGTLLILGLAFLIRQAAIEGPLPSENAQFAGPDDELRAPAKGGFQTSVLGYGAIGIAFFSLIARHYAISSVGRMAVIATCCSAVAAHLAGSRRLALVLGVASYALVSRDSEWIAFIPSLLLADGVSRAWVLFDDSGLGADKSRHFSSTLVLVSFLFALATLQRIGLEGGLQLNTLDFAAGTFGDAFVPHRVVAACLGYKFVVAQILLLTVGVSKMPAPTQMRVFLGVGAAHLARGVVLLLMLFTCGHSYWTAFRVVADMPFAVIGQVVVILATAGLLLIPRGGSKDLRDSLNMRGFWRRAKPIRSCY